MRSMVEGALPEAPSLERSPSTTLRAVPLPLRVRRMLTRTKEELRSPDASAKGNGCTRPLAAPPDDATGSAALGRTAPQGARPSVPPTASDRPVRPGLLLRQRRAGGRSRWPGSLDRSRAASRYRTRRMAQLSRRPHAAPFCEPDLRRPRHRHPHHHRRRRKAHFSSSVGGGGPAEGWWRGLCRERRAWVVPPPPRFRAVPLPLRVRRNGQATPAPTSPPSRQITIAISPVRPPANRRAQGVWMRVSEGVAA